VDLLEVSESFQHEKIHAALGQRCDLLAKCLPGFFERCLSQRLNSCAQRANRSRDPHIEAFGGFFCQPRSRPINVMHFVGDAVPREAEGVGAERVGFNDFGASLEIFVVYGANQIGLGKIQLIVATVDEYAL